MNNTRRRQIGMIKAEIFATMKRLELIEAAESNAISSNPIWTNNHEPLDRIREAVESLSSAMNGLGQITGVFSMSNDPNCPFGSAPMSPEAQAKYDHEQLYKLRRITYGWHEQAVALGFDGVASMLEELELRGIRGLPV